MFRQATAQNTRRARPQRGMIAPLAIPSKGMNARDSLSLMGPQFAINLTNVIVETYGLRTRKGYTEWAKALPNVGNVPTVMNYLPPNVSPAASTVLPMLVPNMTRMLVESAAPRVAPVGKLFAATNLRLYDVTAGGSGPWVAQAGVVATTDYWQWLNFQNIAGAFLIACNEGGGYWYYNGAAWTAPVAGTGVGQIDGVNPANLVYPMSFKKRLWFIEKNSTRAWYLPVSQITGKVTAFDFGEQFPHGGKLVELLNWSVEDTGTGTDDALVAISSQGDVVVYKGIDPNDASSFALKGIFYIGALPVGGRGCVNTGGDIHILSEFGVTPLSILLAQKDVSQLEQSRISYLISPLIARLMRDYLTLPGWNIHMLPKEELMIVRVPMGAADFGGQFLALKVGTGAWCVLKDLPYTDFVNINGACFAGTIDGRVVRAFDGPLDNVLIGQKTGLSIQCVVTPAYQPMGSAGQQKVFKLIRPTFITTFTPSLSIQIMTDYGPAKPSVTPTLPDLSQSYWDEDRWDVGRWSGIQEPITEWLGCHGVGFAGTAQLTYKCGGDTVLASIDYWNEMGGVM